MRHRAFRNATGNDVRSVSGLLAVDDEPVVDRGVGADDDVVGADDVTGAGGDFARLAVLDFLGVHAGVDPTAVAKDGAGKSLQVFEGMKRCLSREAQGGAAVPE